MIISTNKKNINMTPSEKKELVKLSKNKCYYCNHFFNKYLYCINYDVHKYVVCKFCYTVTNIDFFLHHKGIVLLYSILPQLDIIKKTINYIKDNNKIPLFKDIDVNIKKTKLSLLEYLVVRDHIKDNNYKIFFTDKFKIDFMNGSNSYLFSDDTSDNAQINDNNYVDQLIELEEASINNSDLIIINKLLCNKSVVSFDMSEYVYQNIKKINISKEAFKYTNMEYMIISNKIKKLISK